MQLGIILVWFWSGLRYFNIMMMIMSTVKEIAKTRTILTTTEEMITIR